MGLSVPTNDKRRPGQAFLVLFFQSSMRLAFLVVVLDILGALELDSAGDVVSLAALVAFEDDAGGADEVFLSVLELGVSSLACLGR